ncbi:hypothetical protein AAFF_G00000890 [Aldrovandia affinis]|uniref:Uncharacterized protein n=1 Tax=Aldrovandia affinis TaxID=143900 RepID=A0AAD7X373_9TELE|nr:hypothetical protein AAFF_G00000890 [Aldrovandia affinis]
MEAKKSKGCCRMSRLRQGAVEGMEDGAQACDVREHRVCAPQSGSFPMPAALENRSASSLGFPQVEASLSLVEVDNTGPCME